MRISDWSSDVCSSDLYYFGLFMQIDSYAARRGMKGLAASELPSLWQTVKEGWYYIFAFLALIYMLMVLQQEATAPFYATVLLLGINQFSGKHRLDWADRKSTRLNSSH